MPDTRLQTLIRKYPYIIGDGAMGTMLFASGLTQGQAPESWNLGQPHKVAAVHRGYLESGAQLLYSNTFGGNRLRLELHGLASRVRDVNGLAVNILREVIAKGEKEALLAGDIGPTGQVLLPYGELQYDDAVEVFEEQAAALLEAGVDLIVIETMSDLEEVRAAVEGVRRVSQEIEIITTMTFDTQGYTMMGVSPEQALEKMLQFGAAAVGGNCGNGPEEVIAVVEKMHSTAPNAVLVAKANAGVPQLEKGVVVYRATPQDMAEYALKAYQAGAKVIGACCGSTPAHIKAINQALNSVAEVG
ncbi:MAG: homocysteine S-methyltransferase family protein [Anaerolineales bacterium]|nr:homocysteine S-methyltransferase family protein [Anaerolineales bacterium]